VISGPIQHFTSLYGGGGCGSNMIQRVWVGTLKPAWQQTLGHISWRWTSVPMGKKRLWSSHSLEGLGSGPSNSPSSQHTARWQALRPNTMGATDLLLSFYHYPQVMESFFTREGRTSNHYNLCCWSSLLLDYVRPFPSPQLPLSTSLTQTLWQSMQRLPEL
jgi:hypothetical protein